MSEPGLNYKVTVSGASQGEAEVEKLATASGKVGTEAKKSVDPLKDLTAQVEKLLNPTSREEGLKNELREIIELTKAAGGNASEFENVLKKLDSATAPAANNAKGLAASLDAMGSRNNPAKDVLEGITQAARGGEGAIFGLMKTIRAFVSGGVATLNPFALMIAGAGILIGLLPKVVDLFKGTKKSAEDLAKETRDATDSAEELGQVKLESLKERFDEVESSAKRARKEFDATLAALERMDNAEKAKLLAENRSRPGLTDKQRETNEASINKIFADRERARKIIPFEQAVNQADESVATATTERDRALKEGLTKQAEYDRLTAQKAKRDELIKQISSFGIVEAGDFNTISKLSGYQRELNKIPAVDEASIQAAKAGLNALTKVFEEASARLKMAEQNQADAMGALALERRTQKFENDSDAGIKLAERQAKKTATINELTNKRTEAGARAEAGDPEGAKEFRALTAQLERAKAAPSIAPEVQQFGQVLSAKDEKVYQAMLAGQNAIQAVAGSQQALAGKYDELNTKFNELARQVSNSRR